MIVNRNYLNLIIYYSKTSKSNLRRITMVEKGIIIKLIKSHLRNTYLINGLNNLGFHSDHDYLGLADIIFKLIGIHGDSDELFEAYLNWCSEINRKEIFEDEELLEKYAGEIYEFLVVG